MAKKTQLNNLSLHINGNPVSYVPGTCKWKDGLGTRGMRSVVVGGNEVDVIYYEDIATKFGTVSFEIPNIVGNRELVRGILLNENNNTIRLEGTVGGVTYNILFTGAALAEEPEYVLATEGNISLPFTSNPAQ